VCLARLVGWRKEAAAVLSPDAAAGVVSGKLLSRYVATPREIGRKRIILHDCGRNIAACIIGPAGFTDNDDDGRDGNSDRGEAQKGADGRITLVSAFAVVAQPRFHHWNIRTVVGR
jgi:hypothetical protein